MPVPATTSSKVTRPIPPMMRTRSRRRTDPTVENAAPHPKCWSPPHSHEQDRGRSTAMNLDLEYLPVPVTDLDRIRCNHHDDHGNPLVAQTAETGLPLRCCLRLSTAGERVALISYQPSAVGGPYAEVGPVFIHVEDCP